MTSVYQQPPSTRSSSHSSHYQSASSSNPGSRELPPRVVEQVAIPPPSQHQPSTATMREQIQNHPSYHQLPRADLKPFDSYFNDEPKAPVASLHHSGGSVSNGPVHIEERMPRMASNPPLEGMLNFILKFVFVINV